jgi:hypothetical protein
LEKCSGEEQQSPVIISVSRIFHRRIQDKHAFAQQPLQEEESEEVLNCPFDAS